MFNHSSGHSVTLLVLGLAVSAGLANPIGQETGPLSAEGGAPRLVAEVAPQSAAGEIIDPRGSPTTYSAAGEPIMQTNLAPQTITTTLPSTLDSAPSTEARAQSLTPPTAPSDPVGTTTTTTMAKLEATTTTTMKTSVEEPLVGPLKRDQPIQAGDSEFMTVISTIISGGEPLPGSLGLPSTLLTQLDAGEVAPQQDNNRSQALIQAETLGASSESVTEMVAPPSTPSAPTPSAQMQPKAKTIIDLSHPLNDEVLHWPRNSGFKYDNTIEGEFNSSKGETYFLKSDGFQMAIHCGTHLDAPRHFSKTGWTVDEIPLERLVDVPVRVVDLSAKVRANRSYSFEVHDFVDETIVPDGSLVSPNSILLVYTGISDLYSKGKKEYLGTDTDDIRAMRIPGFSREAAEYLVGRGIFGVGIDAPSADSSDRHDSSDKIDPVAHNVFTAANVFILENISNNLARLINADNQMRLTATPLPITGASGSPVRLIAVSTQPGEDCFKSLPNSASSPHSHLLSGTVFLVILMGAVSAFAFCQDTSRSSHPARTTRAL